MNRSKKHKKGRDRRHKGRPAPGAGTKDEAAPQGDGEEAPAASPEPAADASAAAAPAAPPPAAPAAAASTASAADQPSSESAPVGEDSAVHSKDGPLYEVKHSEIMGRYLVAARELQPGDIIISEMPLVVGPSHACKSICLGCYRRLDDTGQPPYRCNECGWPLCASDCPGRGAPMGHSAAECGVWKRAGLAQRPPPAPFAYQAVVALRCMLLREADPARWEALIKMESHNEIRRKLPNIWRHNQLVVVERIREDWGLTQFEEEEIHTICGILEVNSFEIGQNGTRGLYPSAFLLAHDCVPNTSHSDDDDFQLTVRAARRIAPGDSITLSYAYTLQGTLKRREHLKDSKFFDCVCARCSDPTELGTMASALKCSRCSKGYLLSTAPLDADAEWRCGECEFPLPANTVRLLTDRINEELDVLDANDVRGFEAFLQRYRNVLHENHYLVVSAKHSLAQLYGKVEGYAINSLPPQLLKRKRDVCRDILRVFDVLEPGLTRLRGVCLYELHAPIMILATRGFESRSLSRKELAARLREVVDCLEEATRILMLEPPSSSEGMMGLAASDALLRMRDWHKVVASV